MVDTELLSYEVVTSINGRLGNHVQRLSLSVCPHGANSARKNQSCYLRGDSWGQTGESLNPGAASLTGIYLVHG